MYLLPEAAGHERRSGSPLFGDLSDFGPVPFGAEEIPCFDEEDLEVAMTLAAKDAEEAMVTPPPPPTSPPLPPPPPPPPSAPPPPSPPVTEDDLRKAAQAFIGIMPGSTKGAQPSTRGRSPSVKRPNPAAAQGKRSLAQKKARLSSEPATTRKPRLDGKYFKEYACNVNRLMACGVSKEEQFVLEKGLADMDVLKMQKEKLEEISASRNVFIAPRPIVTKKGGPAK